MEQPVKLHVVVWSLLAEVFFNGLIALLTQSYWTYRIWKYYEVLVVNGKVLLMVVVILVVVVEFACVVVVGDLLIASILTYLLQRCKTGFKRTNTMINKLIILAINTGVITSLCAISSLISFLAAPNTFIYISFFFSMGRLYTNSLLTSLNCRQRIREAGNIGTTISEVGNYSSKSPKTFNVSIQVETVPEFASSYGIFQSDNEVEVGPKVLEADLSDGAQSFPV
ncbi:MAG: hypothetical protein NXY57DRAFT_1041793 [Lentinula lateritia]|nr:MAG: hypothetical protein NXY57DRAFT_1041793 [Lentinula lateritia]